MNLYEVASEYKRLLEDIEAGNIPEEAISDTLDSVECELSFKVENIACYIKSLQAESKAIKDEADALALRKKSKDAEAERLINYLMDAMKSAKKDKIETSKCRVTVRKNPESVIVGADFGKWAISNRKDLLTYAEPSPDKTAIKEALKSGEAIPGCSIFRTERLEIK